MQNKQNERNGMTGNGLSRWNVRWVFLCLAAAGLVGLAAAGLRAADKEDKEEDEVKVTLDQVPAAVKATLQRASTSPSACASPPPASTSRSRCPSTR